LGIYSLAVETSTDGGVTWERIWEVPGGFRGPETVEIPLMLGSSALQIAFVFQGNPEGIFYWYVDDVEIVAASFVAEYSEDVSTPPVLLDPGEELELAFPDWTPAALASGVSGDITYIIQGQTRLPGDTNPGNNISTSIIDLEWWHDVSVQKDPPHGIFYGFNIYPGSESVWFTDPGVFHPIGPITAPSTWGGTWADINGGTWYVIANDFEEDETSLYTVDPDDGTMTLIGSSHPDNYVTGIAYDDTTDTMYGVTAKALYTIDLTTGTTNLVSGFHPSASFMVDIAIDNDGNCYGHDIRQDSIYSINLNNGDCTLIGSTGIKAETIQGMEYDKENEVLYIAGYPWGWGNLFTCNVDTGQFTLVGGFQDDVEVDALAIPYSKQQYPDPPDIYFQTGSQPIIAIVENIGTFPETDLTTTAEIYGLHRFHLWNKPRAFW